MNPLDPIIKTPLDYSKWEPNVTKRELFAAMAMQGIISAVESRSLDLHPKAVALRAMDHADALIAALEEKPMTAVASPLEGE